MHDASSKQQASACATGQSFEPCSYQRTVPNWAMRSSTGGLLSSMNAAYPPTWLIDVEM